MTGDVPYTLSYDIRVRDTPVETSPDSARDALLAIIEALKEVVTTTPRDTPIVLHAVTPFPAVMNTTFGREVRFFLQHQHQLPRRYLVIFFSLAVVCIIACYSSLEYDPSNSR